MANLTQQALLQPGATTTVFTEEVVPLGTRAFDTDGNEYIFLAGVASTAANDFVTFDEAHATTRLAANAVGRVAIAQAATVANTYGWYLIYGTGQGASDAIATDSAMYIDATVGRVDDAAVTGDGIQGLISRSTDASTNVATFELNYPFVMNTVFV